MRKPREGEEPEGEYCDEQLPHWHFCDVCYAYWTHEGACTSADARCPDHEGGLHP